MYRRAFPTSIEDRDETPSQRADRNFSEALQELRVAQAGVQILFGFLLALAFTQKFPERQPFVSVLTAALLTSFGAAVSLVAPVAFHRLNFRTGRKDALVWVAHWFALAGLALWVASMLLAGWLVLAFVWSSQVASAVVVALVALGATVLLGVGALLRRL